MELDARVNTQTSVLSSASIVWFSDAYELKRRSERKNTNIQGDGPISMLLKKG